MSAGSVVRETTEPTCGATLMKNGRVVACCSNRSGHKMNFHKELGGPCWPREEPKP